jgi:hypothetical protein
MSFRPADIWKSLGNQVGFYTSVTSEKIPHEPGMYAWFYPLGLDESTNLLDYIKKVQTLLSYDSKIKGKPKIDHTLDFCWQIINHSIEIELKSPTEFRDYDETYNRIKTDKDKFKAFQIAFLKSSIYLPPLYVGKTDNLWRRYYEHIKCSQGNNFCNRFETYAKDIDLPINKIKDLIFVTISNIETPKWEDEEEKLLEFILKYISKPPYSER